MRTSLINFYYKYHNSHVDVKQRLLLFLDYQLPYLKQETNSNFHFREYEEFASGGYMGTMKPLQLSRQKHLNPPYSSRVGRDYSSNQTWEA
jgi:hypothetical protein